MPSVTRAESISLDQGNYREGRVLTKCFTKPLPKESHYRSEYASFPVGKALFSLY